MAATGVLVILSHVKAHARGERVSAGPGIEYHVGNDGLLYQCERVKGPKGGYRVASEPGVLPDHAEALLKSANIREVQPGAVAAAKAQAAAAPAGVVSAGAVVPKDLYDKLRTDYADLQSAHDALKRSHGELEAKLAAKVEPASSAPPPPPPPPARPTEPPPPPPVDPSADAGSEALIAAALALTVGKLGAELAGGKYDAVLSALRAAEVAGKNRTSALGVIDARISSLQG